MPEAVAYGLQDHPSLARIVDAVLMAWPEHKKYIGGRFRDNSLEFLQRTDAVAKQALLLMGDELPRYSEDYRWMCANYMEEQIYFQRHGEYRLQNFAEVNREIYSNAAYMGRYVRGILISQILWINHAVAMDLFRTQFLPIAQPGADYLEVGPGHGLFFYFASGDPRYATLTGWDISDTSIAATRQAMQDMGVAASRYRLVQQDIFDANCPAECFDAVVISEVLEHLEAPDVALKSLHHAMRKNGRIFINVPINAPAPDHIYLWRSTEEFAALVRECGFIIEQENYLPIAGKSLDYCRKYNVDISCVFIARKD